MSFYVDLIIKRGGVRQKNIEISYLYKGSKNDLSSDYTDKNGEVRTEWSDIWKNREIDVFFDGYHKHKIKLTPRDSHTINLPSGCFPHHTKVDTPFGPRCIGDIDDGDFVLSFNPFSCLFTNRRVIKKIVHNPMRILEARMKNGKSLFVTESHSLLTARGYISVANLKCGDHLFVQGDTMSYAILDEITETSRFEPVYNLVVADGFNFIADGFVAHSFTTYKRLQECLWTIYDKLKKNTKDVLLDTSR
jgi:hypothetical protein